MCVVLCTPGCTVGSAPGFAVGSEPGSMVGSMVVFVVGPALSPQLIKSRKSGHPQRFEELLSSPDTKKVCFTEGSGEFGCAGLDFRGSAAKKVRTKRFYKYQSASIQPRTSLPKFFK